jgi:hypothetical protein
VKQLKNQQNGRQKNPEKLIVALKVQKGALEVLGIRFFFFWGGGEMGTLGCEKI